MVVLAVVLGILIILFGLIIATDRRDQRPKTNLPAKPEFIITAEDMIEIRRQRKLTVRARR